MTEPQEVRSIQIPFISNPYHEQGSGNLCSEVMARSGESDAVSQGPTRLWDVSF